MAINFKISGGDAVPFSTAKASRLDFNASPIVIQYRDREKYEGVYSVNPKFTEQILGTAGKEMTDDVTVNPIEYASVSNPQGGTTVYIGGIFNGE